MNLPFFTAIICIFKADLFGRFASIPNYFFNKIKVRRMAEFSHPISKGAYTHLFLSNEMSPWNYKLRTEREKEEEDLCSGDNKTR